MATRWPGDTATSQSGPVRVWPVKTSLDPEAQAYIDRMNVAPSADIEAAINNFFVNNKANESVDSIADIFDCFWITCLETQQASRLNGVKDAHNLTEVNSPTWAANEGYTGDGSTSYLRTNYTPSSDSVVFALDDASMGAYVRLSSKTGCVIGGRSDDSKNQIFPSLDSKFKATINSSETPAGSSNTNTQGLFSVVDPSADNVLGYINGSQQYINSVPETILLNFEMYLLSRNDEGSADQFSDNQLGFAFIGKGSIDQENFFTEVETLLDVIGAGVVS